MYRKIILLTGILFIGLIAIAQSPYLSIHVKMDPVKTESIRYKIEMKICEPKKMTERGDWFTHDTSKIDFASLRSNDINCGEYFDKGMPTLISGKEEEKIFNQFEFGDQVFAWEKIFVFKISNWSSRGWHPEMYIVIPIKYKSFRTSMELTNIGFQEGKVIFITDLKGVYEENRLSIIYSLKDEKGTEVKNFSLKEILENKN